MNGYGAVVMVGTHVQTMGGISTVVRGYIDGGLFKRVDGVYVPTRRDGNSLTKAAAGMTGMSRVLWLMLRANSPLIHVHMSSLASFWRKAIVCVAASALGRPYVVHVHGSEFMKFYDEECGPTAKRFVSRVFQRAALVLALSEQWRVDLLRISPTASVEVLPNAVALADPSAWRQREHSRPVVLFLGRLGARKGTFDLVRAFSSLRPRFADGRLVCAGDGAIAETQALAQELGVGASVECTGWISPDQIAQQLARASIFALPSHAEGVPMALLESMAGALPPVTTPVGGIPEVVQDGHNGLLVTPGDSSALAASLGRLLADGVFRTRLEERARATIAQSYSRDAASEKLLLICRRFGVNNREASQSHAGR